MAQFQARPAKGLDKVDPVWARIRSEAEEAARREPELATFIYENILHHDSLEAAVIHRVSERLGNADVSGDLDPSGLCRRARRASPAIGEASAPTSWRQSTAIRRRCVSWSRCSITKASTPSRRIGWRIGCTATAARISRSICRAVRRRYSSATSIRRRKIGRGIFLDHATGLVVGETAVIDDDVSILHDVTLGGTGKENEDRHPKIRHGVMIGAGAKILGNIEVGHCARIAAGSVVIKPVPNNVTVAGVPAKVVGEAGCPEPSRAMDQMLYGIMLDG